MGTWVKLLAGLSVLSIEVFGSSLVYAGETFGINYAGRIVAPTGAPVQGPVDLTVKFYRLPSDVSPIATVPVLDFTDVELNDGVFQISLGLNDAQLALLFTTGDQVWIEVSAAGATLPRQQFTAVPYALRVPLDDKTLKFGSDGKLTLKAAPEDGKFLTSVGGALTWQALSGGGNMSTGTYDNPVNGVVDNSEALGGQPGSYYRNATNINAGLLDSTFGGTGVNSTATYPASGVIVTESGAQTLTNKTLTSPVITGGTVEASKFKGPGTTSDAVDLATAEVAGILPGANGGTGVNSTATYPTSGVIVTEAGTQTLSNKTLASPVITGGTVEASKFKGSGTTSDAVDLATAEVAGVLPGANGGTGVNSTATYPASGVIVTEAATQSLSNKTLVAPIAGTIYGGSAASSTLTLAGTNNGSPSNAHIILNETGQGRVGIGTNAPNASLEVVGQIRAQGTMRIENSTSSPTAIYHSLYNADPTDGNGSRLAFRALTTGAGAADREMAAVRAEYSTHDDATRTASLHFETANAGAANTRMTITPTGSVGVGTTNPGTKLELYDGALRVKNLAGGSVDFQVAAGAGTAAYTFPTSGQANGYVLKTDGSGVLSWGADSVGGAPAFNAITSGSNTTATMTIGSGATLGVSGTGIVEATKFKGSGTSTDAVDLGTAEVSGQLGASNGGTGVSSTATFPLSGVIVTEAATQTLTNKTLTSPTITGGTVEATKFKGSGTTSDAVDLGTAEVSGTLALGNGGTGATSFTNNGVLVGSGALALSATAAGTQYQVLRAGAGGSPAFGSINLDQAAAVTGALPLGNGGTGATTQAGAANAVLPSQSGQNGKYLTTNGSDVSWGTPSASIAVGSAVTSGINGSLLFVGSGNLTQDNANLFWDDANNRLGISSTTPSAALDVVGGTLPADGSVKSFRTAGTISSPSAANYVAQVVASTSGSATSMDVAGLNITVGAGLTGTNRVSGLQVFNNSTGTGAQGGWADVGNYGVTTRVEGTTTGSNTGLSGVAANGDYNYGVAGATVANKANAKNIGVWGQALNSSGGAVQVGGYFSLTNLANPGLGTNSAGLIADNGTTTSPIFQALDNGTSVVSIIDGGNVGIGTPSPGERLSIYSGTRAALGFGVGGFAAPPTGATTSNGTKIRLLESQGASNLDYAFGVAAGELWSTSNGAFTWYTGAGAGTPLERMRIDSAGNVGIGTSVPGVKLDVNGTNVELDVGHRNGTASDSYFYANATDGSGYAAIGAYKGDLSGPTKLAINGVGGNVGVGTTDPTAKLHIGGTAGTDGIKFPDGTLQTSAAGADTPVLRFSRTTVAYNDTDANKDSTCSTDFGSGYTAARGQDVTLHWGPKYNNSNAPSFNVRQASATYILNTAGQMTTTTNGTQAVACIKVGAFMRASRSTVAYSASAGTKDSTCSGDYGASYGAATTLEITSYSKMNSPYDLGANFPFTVRDDTTFSYYQYSLYVTATAGGTHPALCIRIN